MRKTTELAVKLNKPIVCGSDTHQAVQYGCIKSNFVRECNTVHKLYREMCAGIYENSISDQAAFQVKTACILKRALKEIHELQGDYVSVLLGK